MADLSEASLQERYAPKNACFGCGPANPDGLQIRSFPAGDGPWDAVVAQWTAQPHHQAFPGVLNGGIVGALLDCHGNWTAVLHLMRRDSMDHPPCCVTAEFAVKLRRPTPMDGVLQLSARAVASEGNRVEVEATLSAGERVTAECRGIFVAVKPDHPAHHRW